MALVNFFPFPQYTGGRCISLHTQQQCHSHQAHAPTANDFENIIQDAADKFPDTSEKNPGARNTKSNQHSSD